MTGLRWLRTWHITWHGVSFGPGRYMWNETAGAKVKTALSADLERMYQHRDRPNLMPREDAEAYVAAYDIALWEQEYCASRPIPGHNDLTTGQPWDEAQ